MNRIENLDYILSVLMAEQQVRQPLPATLEDKQRLMRALMNTRPPWPATIVETHGDASLLQAQDRELQLQLQEKGIVSIDDIIVETHCNASPLLWQGDITRLRVDAIVNAANSQMLGCWHPLHNCIDNCIHSAAGIQLREECHRLMQGTELPTGEARITAAYNLPCKYVIHTVGPIVQGGQPTPEQERQLADCYRNCLALAERGGCRSIAFCCISTGVFGYPNEAAARVAVDVVRRHLACEDTQANCLRTIVFNVFKKVDYEIYRELLGQN